MESSEDMAGRDNVRAIRALAHPLRLQLLDILRFEGPSTATLLAHRLGESSGATSYHLRLLARYGYIEDAPHAGNHERWWRYRERPVKLPSATDSDSSERHLMAELLSREAQALDRYLAARTQLSKRDDAAFYRSVAIRLTAEEFDHVRQELMAICAKLRRADAEEAPADAAAIHLVVFGFPQIVEES